MGTHHTHLVNEDDDDEDDDDEDAEDEDVYMYPTDMHPDERDAYRSAVRASKASNWEREQHENIVGSKRKSGESFTAKQKNIKDIFKGGAIKETMGRLISKFFIYESVAPVKVKSHHFKNMIIGAQQAGMGIEPPSPYEIKNKYLEMEYKEIEAYVNQQRENGRHMVDASNYIKDHKYIYELLKTIIKEVGKENVVQIVTNNGSAFMKAGKQLMKKYNLYWTPCAAHCIDLIFEDIGKRPNVIEVINNARKITNFIYNHGWLLAQMRKYCGGDIVRPGATRFATNYIALDSLLKKMADLKKLFMSDEWAQHKLSRTKLGRELEQLLFDHTYWDRLTNIVSLYEPLYVVFRLVDSEVVPTMPFVYELMHVMKENLIRQGAGDWMFKIIQDRWQKTLKHPLHAAAYFLNPRFQYRHGVGSDPELLQAVHDVFAKLDPTTESLGQFGNELELFRDAKRGFGDRAAIASRSTMVPVGNPDPRIAAHTREFGVNVERVLSEEVHFVSFSKDTDDSLHATLHSHQEIDSTSAGHSSRPSAAGTSASGYDGSRGGTDDGGDNGGGDIDERQHSQYPISQFTCENDFTHCTQDEDHGSRRAGPGIGAIGRPYRGRERMMEPYNEELLSGSFESMSIGTQFSDSSNEANVYPPHVMSYGQPSSSTDEEYGVSHYSPSRQMPYQIPYQMEEGFGVNTWVNFEYPIHVEAIGRTQEIYAWHVRIYNQYYRGSLTWYQYCLQQQAGVPSSINPIEPHRNSFWY
ncbi:hypothetical protein CK203_077811 [Vitis vinifera]|uniref:DUF659 domain-containing protein n=1 Tax=Vitis vinifera TaxID=29760 RepID=A0A438EWT6_VITVI|nr:hypothetical protein CK203_077811 [Vitis vinifera]